MSLGTTYGFSLVYPQTAGSGGGGGQTLAWQRDEFDVTAAFSPGSLFLGLTQVPLSEMAISVISEIQPLHPADYTWDALNQGIFIQFTADPSTDTTTGTWHFVISYPYVA